MNVKQNLSILFYLKRKKMTTDGMVPIYCRLTIDGLQDEISLSEKVLPEHWLTIENIKTVSDQAPDYKSINTKMRQMTTDLERHFTLVQATEGLATPAQVKKSYTTPLSGQRQLEDRKANDELCQTVDALIDVYLRQCSLYEKAHGDGRRFTDGQEQTFNHQRKELKQQVKTFADRANQLFDDNGHQKTFLLMLNEYLLDFLQLCLSGHRAYTTLEKWAGKKRKYKQFLQDRYKAKDLPLQKLTYTFIQETMKYFLVTQEVNNNTATKYAQHVKDLMNRAVARKWVSANIFTTYKCHYDDTDPGYPTPQEMDRLTSLTFHSRKLGEIRDIFIFQCFTGYSYADIRRLSNNHQFVGIDGKIWTSIARKKTTGDETLPLLPNALAIAQKYEQHPVCIRRNVLLPVPSCEEYNRQLKLIAEMAGIRINMTTHTARYYFANEVTYNNGVQLKTVSRLLGHKSLASTAKYVKGNRKHLSDSMAGLEELLFNQEGQLKPAARAHMPTHTPLQAKITQGARVVRLRPV